jgi:hypothetical protein
MSESATSPTSETQTTTSRRRLWELMALLLFLLVGSSFAAPCLCFEGAVRGRYTTALLALAACRLAWCVYRRTFRYRDYFLYLAIVIGFCVWAGFQAGHP